MIDRRALRGSAALLLVGQVLYIVVTLFHADGEANNHPAVFAEYAASRIWTAVHVGQFASMAILLAGLFALSFALHVQGERPRWVAQLGAACATVTLGLYGLVLAVDGVALKRAVNAWANAPDAEKATRFANAETMRWLEWGARSYANFALGLSVLLFAIAVARTARIPRPIPYLMALTALTYLVQGWVAGTEGFSQTHTTAIILAEVMNLVWMTWLVVVAWRMRDAQPLPPGR